MSKASAKKTPHQIAVEDAARLVELRNWMKTVAEEEEDLKLRLTEYVDSTGETDLVHVVAQVKNGPPTLQGATGKKKEVLVEQLLSELPQCGKTQLDLMKVEALAESDVNVKNALKAKGLSIERSTGYTFKTVTA
jgi:ferritin